MSDNERSGAAMVSVELPAATVARLRERAAFAGLPLEVYLDRMSEENGPPVDRVAQKLAWLKNRTPADAERTLAELLAASRPPRPLPEGKTLYDVVEGSWPGDETDEQIRDALDRLS